MSRNPHGLFSDPPPSSFCPRSYWMPPMGIACRVSLSCKILAGITDKTVFWGMHNGTVLSVWPPNWFEDFGLEEVKSKSNLRSISDQSQINLSQQIFLSNHHRKSTAFWNGVKRFWKSIFVFMLLYFHEIFVSLLKCACHKSMKKIRNSIHSTYLVTIF